MSPPPLPASQAVIEVMLRREFPDPAGASALSLLRQAGVMTAREVRESLLYDVRGPLSAIHLQQAARELLADPVTQEFRLAAPAPIAALNGMNQWRVEVWLKDAVSDPVGDSVREAIGDLGLPAPLSVRAGRAWRIEGKCHRVQLEKAVSRTLANPVIHRFIVRETHA